MASRWHVGITLARRQTLPEIHTASMSVEVHRMTTETVITVVERFIKDNAPTTLVIRGKWGVGKTYFWRKCIAKFAGESSRKQYSYVSLFGCSSIKDIQIAACVNSIGVTSIRDPAAPPAEISLQTDITPTLKKMAALVSNHLPGSWGKSATVAFETMAQHYVRASLICFDDFERLTRGGVTVEEVLGFVTSLKEEKNCKVVLIFNDEELKDQADVYRRYREKVIDVEVQFEPSVDEAVLLALPDDVPHRDLVIEKLKILEVRNIRLIRKISRNIDLVYPLVREAREEISKNVVVMAAFLTWMEYGPHSERPSADLLKDWNLMMWQYGSGLKEKAKRDDKGEKAAEKDQRAARWSEWFERYGITSFDPCDMAVERAIRFGYVEDSGLDVEVEKLMRQADATDAENRFTAAWKLFHDSLGDDEAEIVAIIDREFDAAAPAISPGNLSATVVLLRSLARDDLANDLIDRYIRIRGGQTELFDPDSWGLSFDIQDEVLKERFAAQRAVAHHAPTLLDAAKAIGGRKGWSVEQMDVLSAASANDLYNLYKLELGRSRAGVIKACLNFRGDARYGHIADNAITALKRIGGESRVDRLRVERHYGITPD